MKRTMKNPKTLILTSALCMFAGTASANLITNGSFEEPGVDSGWAYFSADNVNGWEGSNVEIWESGFNGVNSFDGDQHAELNAHGENEGAWTLYQDITTTPGEAYELFFAYRARNNTNESFRVSAVGSDFGWSKNDHTTDQWSVFEETFVAGSELTRIQFEATNPSEGTVGNFLDDVRVTSAKVPAPGTLALFGLGLLGLGASRKRSK